MRESTIYQKWRSEALKEGRVEGRAEGIQREAEFILRLAQRRLGSLPPQMSSQIRGLPIEQIETLGEFLLDIATLSELEDWLQDQSQGSR